MSTVPQPVNGSVSLKFPIVPDGLSPGFYLDEDIALEVGSDGVIIIAPDTKTAEQIASNLSRTAWNWRSNQVNSKDLVDRVDEYAAWLGLVAEPKSVGGLNNASRGSGDVAKVSQAAS